MAICVNQDDFQVDPVTGQLELRPRFVQSPALAFTHLLDGAANVFEKITEIPNLVLPAAGLWVVTMDVRGNATNTPAAPGIVVNTSAFAQLRLNDVLVPGSETMLQLNSQGVATTQEPALQLHGTGSATRVVSAAAGATLSVWGARASDAGTNTEILSSPSGRSRITAWRIGSV